MPNVDIEPDALIATAMTLLINAAFVALLIATTPQRPASTDDVGHFSETVSVTFFASSPEEESLSQTDTVKQPPPVAASPTVVDALQQDSIDRTSSEPISDVLTNSSTSAFLTDPLRSQYLEAIRSTIVLTLQANGVSGDLSGCQLHIEQLEGGKVISSIGECASSEAEGALQNISALMLPLPYAGYERVFTKQISVKL